MALDKNFLKYKLEKIKNDRIFKDQDTETKKKIRKENAKVSAEEADAIHSYLTGEDEIDRLDNKSYLENRLPGSLFIGRGNQLNIRQVQTNPKSKKSRLSRLLKRFKTVAKANIDESKQIIVLKKIFDKLNLNFKFGEIKTDGTLVAGGYKTHDSRDEYEGITEDYIVTDVVENADGTLTYIRKRIIVKNGLIVGQDIISQ
jgi:hypothetical protein|tara:strand:- start:315 stop:917 length:603 start_codon:yes stop_codon:yes gene_type:complete